MRTAAIICIFIAGCGPKQTPMQNSPLEPWTDAWWHRVLQSIDTEDLVGLQTTPPPPGVPQYTLRFRADALPEAYAYRAVPEPDGGAFPLSTLDAVLIGTIEPSSYFALDPLAPGFCGVREFAYLAPTHQSVSDVELGRYIGELLVLSIIDGPSDARAIGTALERVRTGVGASPRLPGWQSPTLPAIGSIDWHDARYPPYTFVAGQAGGLIHVFTIHDDAESRSLTARCADATGTTQAMADYLAFLASGRASP